MTNAQNDGGGNGTNTAGLYCGGGPSHTNKTEEFTGAVTVTKNLSTS